MPEHQAIERKEAWHDEYLKWICGYANAYGGILYIGKDDNGVVKGIEKSKYLLEMLPSKITNTMGIIVDINLCFEGELEYLEIIVDKYPSLISFRGKSYYRSGSTMREITVKSGMIEAWGRGFDKIKEACEKYGAPLPEYDINEEGIMVLCKACDRYLRILHGEIHPVQSEQDSEQDMINTVSEHVVKIQPGTVGQLHIQ